MRKKHKRNIPKLIKHTSQRFLKTIERHTNNLKHFFSNLINRNQESF
ncbi:hypothetical protein [Enterococcus phage vB_Efs19_KEN17]